MFGGALYFDFEEDFAISTKPMFEIVTLCIFFVLVMIFEVVFQVVNRGEKNYRPVKETMSIEEFEKNVKEGK